MGEDKKEKYKGMGTLESIKSDEFYKQQNIYIESFGKCPGCENETLNLDSRICECGYRLDHDIPYVVNKTKESNKNLLDYGICSCGMHKKLGSMMCIECFGKNSVNHNY